ncbi:hypothetical protein HOG17_01935 [Candidatus Peregrinibacteria bacterium]|mgnify:CR=1 FL=1|nr:hypothetical protein [Candidatus Peregrinibacteria bacterium]MBT4148483.1 hypothetical protein [Candidatus Peregrinibacteria bacterium]MBT4366662.1 hypothetical protein [Candidatus Peregrinibacteria bacterium]MBT4456427.1 hypothetical protein [Candidatus Peregrinibacteria bacterium]
MEKPSKGEGVELATIFVLSAIILAASGAVKLELAKRYHSKHQPTKESEAISAPAPAEATKPQMGLWEQIVEKTRKALSQEILP